MDNPKCSDHPRSRGEYPWDSEYNNVVKGSSPLSRGIRGRYNSGRLRHRIIPALAGNTLANLDARRQGRDHPRSRGEYLVPEGLDLGSDGSSPLSRGILRITDVPVNVVRIISALAGNTTGG